MSAFTHTRSDPCSECSDDEMRCGLAHTIPEPSLVRAEVLDGSCKTRREASRASPHEDREAEGRGGEAWGAKSEGAARVRSIARDIRARARLQCHRGARQ